MKLPISVVLPIFNCRERLSRHLQSVTLWADQVNEIIVVDSGSTDGSLELSKEILSAFQVRFLHHPPGLYQSWNAGIAATTSPLCYISTVEDPITGEGLTHLYTIITNHDADVLISPPEMRNHDGSKPVETRMPSNILADVFRTQDISDRLLGKAEAIALCCGLLPHGILGSSASNLYRTSFLQQNPFPTDFGHCGDTAWGITVSPFARIAFTSKTCAQFYCQTNFKNETPDQQLARHRQLADLATKKLLANSPKDPEIATMLGWFESYDKSTQVLRKWLCDQFTYREELESQVKHLRGKYERGILSYLHHALRDEWKRFFMRN